MRNIEAFLITLLVSTFVRDLSSIDAALSNNIYFYWGAQRGRITAGDDCELMLHKHGGSGITSKASFLYGSISMRMKLVPGNSAGTVTAFYLSSFGKRHDEIDFEFLGNVPGQPYIIHTNIFTQGRGKREQQFRVWFNPSKDFHNYTIFWNPFQVVNYPARIRNIMVSKTNGERSYGALYRWLVDGTPIRVYRNYHDPEINFPDSQAMRAFASLWNADQWATQGGRVKTDWSLAPFTAKFQDFDMKACVWRGPKSVHYCTINSPTNWWTDPMYSELSDSQLSRMNSVRKEFMIYDYCRDPKRIINGDLPKECSISSY